MSYIVEEREPIADVYVTVSASGRQHRHRVQLSRRVEQPVGVHAVVELHEVRVQCNHRHAMRRRFRDDRVNGKMVKVGDREESASDHAALKNQRTR